MSRSSSALIPFSLSRDRVLCPLFDTRGGRTFAGARRLPGGCRTAARGGPPILRAPAYQERRSMADPILLARRGEVACHLLPALANRHGLITGATGTGKTVTLQKLAESLSRQGVPVFVADVKGDLAGIARPGQPSARLSTVLAE